MLHMYNGINFIWSVDARLSKDDADFVDAIIMNAIITYKY
jgi:hypothetical protein